jgi:hypothetical protein
MAASVREVSNGIAQYNRHWCVANRSSLFARQAQNVIFLTARFDESLDVKDQFEGVPQLQQVCQTRVG